METVTVLVTGNIPASQFPGVLENDFKNIIFRLRFTLGRNAKLDMVKKSYAKRVGVPVGDLTFVHDCSEVGVGETPYMLERKDYGPGEFEEFGESVQK